MPVMRVRLMFMDAPVAVPPRHHLGFEVDGYLPDPELSANTCSMTAMNG
jgi:hypothetical protein